MVSGVISTKSTSPDRYKFGGKELK